jgi:hypothetical protein
LVYSIDSFSSFENLNFWYNSIKEQLDGKNYILAIVGNKKDLINDIIVTEEQGKNYANDVKGVFRLISAKEEQESINKLFDELLDDISQINYESITNSYVIKKPKKSVKKVKKKDKRKEMKEIKKKDSYTINNDFDNIDEEIKLEKKLKGNNVIHSVKQKFTNTKLKLSNNSENKIKNDENKKHNIYNNNNTFNKYKAAIMALKDY